MIGVIADGFTHGHIALTAATTGVICAVIGLWRLSGPRRVVTAVAVGAVAGFAVYLWRASANMAQLNNDGLPGFSANDWLAPVVTSVALSIFADVIPPPDRRRYAQVRAASTVVAFAVNVITI